MAVLKLVTLFLSPPFTQRKLQENETSPVPRTRGTGPLQWLCSHKRSKIPIGAFLWSVKAAGSLISLVVWPPIGVRSKPFSWSFFLWFGPKEKWASLALTYLQLNRYLALSTDYFIKIKECPQATEVEITPKALFIPLMELQGTCRYVVFLKHFVESKL